MAVRTDSSVSIAPLVMRGALHANAASAPISERSGWTWEKAQIVFFKTFAVVSVTAGSIVSGLVSATIVTTPLGWGVGASLCAMGGIALIRAYTIVDYSDPGVIEGFRKQAVGLSLDALIKKHGLERIFLHAIVSPWGLQRLYWQKVERFSLEETIAFYEIVQEAYSHVQERCPRAFLIPSPQEKTYIFNDELRSMSLWDLLEKYPIDKLRDYRIINPVQATRLRELLEEKKQRIKEHRRIIREIGKEFQIAVTPFQTQLEQELFQAELHYRSLWDPIRISSLDQLYSDQIKRIESISKARKEAIKIAYKERIKPITEKRRHSPEDRLYLNNQSRLLTQALALVESQEKEARRLHLINYNQRRREYSNDIRLAEVTRATAIARAQSHYRTSTTGLYSERDRRMREEKARFEEVITRVNQQSNEIRRL